MRAVNILRGWLSPLLPFVHTSRAHALWKGVEAAVAGGVLSLTAMGHASAGQAEPKHRIKAMDRLLGNEALQGEITGIYAAVAWLLIRHDRPVILIDWTQVGAKHWALVAAVPVDGRALPICADVQPERLLGNARVHRAFLRKLWDVLPRKCRPICVTDAGFATMWFESVERMGWDFVGRVRGHRHVRRVGTSAWVPNQSLHGVATTTPRDVGMFDLCRMHPRPRRVVLVRQVRGRRKHLGRRGRPLRTGVDKKYSESAKQPWVLTTSLSSAAARIASIYATRMQIEEFFRDAKNHRFGWSLGGIVAKIAARLNVLLLIAALGVVAVTLVGLAAEVAGVHRRFQANTVRNKRVLSLFVLGTRIVATARHLLRSLNLASALGVVRRRIQSVAAS